MLTDELPHIAALLRSHRSGALGTLQDGAPFVSFVAYAPEPGLDGFLLHLSRLAAHTRQLLADPRASLMVSEPDDRRDDAQTLARITLVGAVAPIPPDAAGYGAARARYLAHLPAAAMLFELADFSLFRLTPESARYVGGFARALTLTPDQLRRAAAAG